MNIIIAGAGEVGFHLAKMMSQASQDIFLIDDDNDRLSYVQSHVDIFGINGDAKNISVLEEAKIASCDLLIAATSSEETNLLVCILGRKLGAKKTVCRINSYEEVGEEMRQLYLTLGVDTIISPVELASQEIVRLIEQSAFTDDYDFDGGKLSVFGIALASNSPLINKTVAETSYLNPSKSFKPLIVLREGETFMIQNGTKLLTKDIVYFISSPEGMETVTNICGTASFEISNVMILGGSRLGVLTAEHLEKDYNVVLIERNKDKAHLIAEHLKETLVIHADGRDIEVLEDENLDDMDAFIAVTDHAETNIISSLFAKSHGVKKTIAGVENLNYIDLSHQIGIDTLINKKLIAANSISRFIRKGEIADVATLHGVDVEIIEYFVTADCKIISKTIREFNFPKEVNIAGIVRGDEGFIPFGGFQVVPGDKVIVLTKPGSSKLVEKLFNG